MVIKREKDEYWPPERQEILPSKEGPYIWNILLLIFSFRLRTYSLKTGSGGSTCPEGEPRANGRSREEPEGPGMKWANLSSGEAGITGETSYFLPLRAHATDV